MGKSVEQEERVVGWRRTGSLAEQKWQVKGQKVDQVAYKQGGGWRRQEEQKMKRMAERGGERLTTVTTDGTALAGGQRPLEKGAETSIRGSCFGIYQDPQEDNTHRVYDPWRKNNARIWLSCYTYSNDEKESPSAAKTPIKVSRAWILLAQNTD